MAGAPILQVGVIGMREADQTAPLQGASYWLAMPVTHHQAKWKASWTSHGPLPEAPSSHSGCPALPSLLANTMAFVVFSSIKWVHLNLP